jgi:hypothetical protein
MLVVLASKKSSVTDWRVDIRARVSSGETTELKFAQRVFIDPVEQG